MTERNTLTFLNGGEEMGMTNEQYKGMLLDQRKSWKEILKLAIKAGNTEIQEKVESELETIDKKLEV